MPTEDELKRWQDRATRRLAAVEAMVARTKYPTPASMSYIARVGNVVGYFPTDDHYTHSWFYPRYAREQLHEPAASQLLVDELTPQSVFVDVGAHLGYFTVLGAAVARTVFAIEAQEAMIPRIHRNVCANHQRNVHTMLAAAGDTRGFAPIPKIGGPGTHVGDEDVDNLVPLVRLDDYFTGDHTPDFIKIDTEGYELKVLKGAAEILKTRPKMIVEVHDKMRLFGDEPGALYDLLIDAGYRLHAVAHRQNEAALTPVSRDEVETFDNRMVYCEPA